jgi:subtilisin family serine protease
MDSQLLRTISLTLLTALVTGSAAYGGVREGVELSQATAATAGSQEKALYIVQFAEPPALALSDAGGAKAATIEKPTVRAWSRRNQKRQRFQKDAPRVQAHVRALQNRQAQMLAKIGAANEQVYDYQYTFNGVAVKLTERQARRLSSKRGVKAVWKDSKRKVVTNNSPTCLGLFDGTGGLRSDLGLQGEDVIIGVIDSGVKANHPSLSDRDQSDQRPRLCRGFFADTLLGLWLCARFRDREGAIVFDPPPDDWNGICQTGESFPASACNNKLIGARFYRAGFDEAGPADPNEFNSPADADGHGTHIASIAAGNKVEASIFDREIGVISGMAPRARVAVYKACWKPSKMLSPMASMSSTTQSERCATVLTSRMTWRCLPRQKPVFRAQLPPATTDPKTKPFSRPAPHPG